MKKVLLLFALMSALCVQTLSAQRVDKPKDMSGKDSNGRKYVDLGLPGGVLWATCNVGADKPEGYGLYFAWGETEGHVSDGDYWFSWSSYDYSFNNKMTKYGIGISSSNWDSSLGTSPDDKTVLDPEDDAATANWGAGWRMPTMKEINDLYDSKYTTIERMIMNGVKGCLITSKSNGNSIFLPAAGIRYGRTFYNNSLFLDTACFRNGITSNSGSFGLYWSSSLSTASIYAYSLYFGSGGIDWCYGERCFGQSVRPVRVASEYPADADNKDVTRSLKVAKKMEPSGYVDLGLPGGVVWATYNVGADKPEDCGLYFAWGETVGYAKGENHSFYNGNYKWCNRSNESTTKLTKYCTDSKYGTEDDKTVLDPEDDAATANWGAGWRMPTKKERDDLINYCTWTWKTNYNDSGVNGYEVKSKINGNSIFLPTVGYRAGTNLYLEGLNGGYWSSSLVTNSNNYVCNLDFDSGDYGSHSQYRCYGQSVRAVRVVKKKDISGKDSNGREFVDLGLPGGVLWATCNVGASKPEDYGKYFAWGETKGYAKGKRHSFKSANYKWCNGSDDIMTKYCTSSKYGTEDNKPVLDPEDDVATANWGAGWRMPTKKERDDLINYCTWTWKTNYNGSGVNGYEVKSKINGNSIFLPAAGYRSGTSLFDEGASGVYWSSSLSASNSGYASDLSFSSRNVRTYSDSRYYGFPVRPVRVSSE